MEIIKIELARLHNNEHYEFINEVIRTITDHTPEAIDIAALFPRLQASFITEDESYKIVVKSAYTRMLNEIDVVRDSNFINFKGTVRTLQNHFQPAVREAAYRIMIELDAYGDITKKGYDAETADITNIIQSLRGKLAADVATTGLGDWVDQIEQINLEFTEAVGGRYEEQSDKNSLVRLRTARLATDADYRAIVNRINAGIVYNGADRYEAFVSDLNARVKHYNNIIAIRKGRAAAEKAKNDTPADPTNPDDTPTTPPHPTDPPPRDEE